MWAAASGHLEVMQLLVSASADIEAEDKVGGLQGFYTASPAFLLKIYLNHSVSKLYFILTAFRPIFDIQKFVQ